MLLRFDQAVDTSLGQALQVFDASGGRVDSGEILRPAPNQVAVTIDTDLPDGTYTVAWRAISADADPIRGAFVFHVGAPSESRGIVTQVSQDSPSSSTFSTEWGGTSSSRSSSSAQAASPLIYPLSSADPQLQRRLYVLLAVCAGALAVWSLLGIAFQGAKASGGGLSDAFHVDKRVRRGPDALREVELMRAGLALGILGLALALRRAGGQGRDAGSVAAVLLAAGLVVTPSFAGHASATGPLASVSDIAHVMAAAAWVGGLAFVIIALWWALEERWPLATRCVPASRPSPSGRL